MRILFINNDGGGFADHIDVEPGTTVAKLFGQRMHESRPQDYLIRVNRQHAASDQVLQENDRVSITPTKIEGAEVGPASRVLVAPSATSATPAGLE